VLAAGQERIVKETVGILPRLREKRLNVEPLG
jgi:hypothetical protein